MDLHRPRVFLGEMAFHPTGVSGSSVGARRERFVRTLLTKRIHSPLYV